jgi:hypothetical protein
VRPLVRIAPRLLALALAAEAGLARPAADELVVAPALAPFVGWIREGRAPGPLERAGLDAGVTAGLGLPPGVRIALGPAEREPRAGDTAVLYGALVGRGIVGWPEGRLPCSATLELGRVTLDRVELVDPAARSAWVRERAATRPHALDRSALDRVLGELRASGEACERPGLVVHEVGAGAVRTARGPALDVDAMLHLAGQPRDLPHDLGRLEVHGFVPLPASAALRSDAPPVHRAPRAERTLGEDVDRVLALVAELERWPLRPWIVQSSVTDPEELFVWGCLAGPEGPDGAPGRGEDPGAWGTVALGVRGLDPAEPGRARAWWDEIEVDLDAARAAFRAAVAFAADDALGFLAAFPPRGGEPGCLLAAATPAAAWPWAAERARIAVIPFGAPRPRELAVGRVSASGDRADRRFRVQLPDGGYADLSRELRFCVDGGPLLSGVRLREHGRPDRAGRLLGGICDGPAPR